VPHTYRITTRRPVACVFVPLLEDVDADELRVESTGRILLISDQVVIHTPRTIAVRRVDPRECHVEHACAGREREG